MSILDTFFIMFDSNSAAVKQGLDQVTQAGKQTQAELNATGKAGVTAAHDIEQGNSKLSESFDKVREHADHLAERLIEHALEVAAAFKALFEVEKLVENFFEQAETSEKLGFMAKQLGVSVSELDAWGNAATREGGTAQGFASSLENLNFQLTRISVTGHSRSLKFFQQLGIDATKAKNAFELLPQLHEKFVKMDAMKSAAFGRAIGLDQGTIRLLQSEDEEFKKLFERQQKLGLITAEDTKVAHEFEDQWLDIKQLFRNIVIDSDTGILPLLTNLLSAVEDFVEFLRDHKDLVVGFFIAAGAAALYAARGVIAWTLALLTNPVVLMTTAVLALIAAFALAYDDLRTFANGGKSLIGELAKEFPLVGVAARALVEGIAWLRDRSVEIFEEIIDWIKRIPEGFRQWGEIFTFVGEKISELVSKIENMLPALPEKFKAIFDNIKIYAADFTTGLVDGFTSSFNLVYAALEALVKLFAAGFKLITDLIVDPLHAFQNFGETVNVIFDKFVGKLGDAGIAFLKVGQDIAQIGQDIIDVFNKIWDSVGWIIDKIINAFTFGKGAGGGTSGMGHGGRHVEQEAPGSIPGSAGGVHGANPLTDPLGALLDAPGVTPVPSGIPGTNGSLSPSGAVGAPAVPGLMPTQVANDIGAGQNTLAATNSPLLAQTSSSLSADTNNHVEITC